MINTTENIKVIQTGEVLSKTIISAISKAKQCVKTEIFDDKHINAEKITVASKGPFFRASIIRFFLNHEDVSIAPEYDEKWIERLYAAAQKKPSPSTVRSLIPSGELNTSWINKTSCQRFKQDAVLIIHFLWSEGATLLPMNFKLPTTLNPETKGTSFEFAANYYPEVLALVRKPFVQHIDSEIPDVRNYCPYLGEKALGNYGYYSWRLVRASTWYQVQDLNEQDVQDFWEYEKTDQKRGIPKYPISPKLILASIESVYPQRCNFSDGLQITPNFVPPRSTSTNKSNNGKPRGIGPRSVISRESLESGAVFISAEIREKMETWFFYQERYLQKVKQKTPKSVKAYRTSFGKLNNYLCDEVPKISGPNAIPQPKDFNKKHIEGFDGLPPFLDYLSKEVSGVAYRGYLYKIDDFFDYLESFSSTERKLKGFRNPISSIDFPVVRNRRTTSKKAFDSNNFGPLIEYLYALEAFGFFLSERIFSDKNFTIKNEIIDPSVKVYETEKLGFIPIMYYNNPGFDSNKPASNENKEFLKKPINFIHKQTLPLLPRIIKTHNRISGRRTVGKKTTMFPNIIPIQHVLVALETGIRNIHIRWLDRRTYDKNIDRSYPIPPVCDLHVPTDKAHGEWDSKVSNTLMELLDRQVFTHSWFDEPGMLDEVWYDEQEDSDFGKIATLFPRGLAAGLRNGILPGPFGHDTISKHFKRLIFSFDLFCRYSLGIKPSNKMHPHFKHVKSLDTVEEFIDAFEIIDEGLNFIEHTPHSCRASVVSEWIRIIPPDKIGRHKTGHSSASQVIYYAKLDPRYLKENQQYQRLSVEDGIEWDDTDIRSIKAEERNSHLRKAMKQNRDQASIDYGATSFDRPTDDGEILSGVRILKTQPSELLSYQSTHICPCNNWCPPEIVRDLKAIPGERKPCGGCYYSVKTVDHIPRISGHIRSLTEEAATLKEYIDDAKAAGASIDSLAPKAAHRQYLADEITAWSVTLHCLHHMYQDIKKRDDFLVEKPEIVIEQLEGLVLKEGSLDSLIARIAEAKNHAEFFTPRLKDQIREARHRILARTGAIHKLMEDQPTGYSMLDEFRGIIRSTCETLGLSIHELAQQMDRPIAIGHEGRQEALDLIMGTGIAKDA